MKLFQNITQAAYATLALAVGAYIAHFVVRIVAGIALRESRVPTGLASNLFIGPILAILAVTLGHYVRSRVKDGSSPTSAGISLAGIILGYIFLSYTVFVVGFIMWFSHAMKDFR